MNNELDDAVQQLLDRDREARRVIAALACAKEFFTGERYRRTRTQLEGYVAMLRECCPGFTTENYQEALKRIYVDSYIR